MEDFYHRLSYSFGNEDWETEKKALKIKKGDHVVCVTASGDRPLNLLTEDCGKITSVDTNPMQNALLDLKRTAISELSYDDYLAFLGIRPCKKRIYTYRELASKLDNTSDRLWMRHRKAIKRGVLFQGVVERRLKLTHFFINLIQGKKVDHLFSFTDSKKQAEFAQKSFDTKIWRSFLALFLRPTFTRLFIKDPGLYEFVDPEIHVGRYLHDRIQDALSRFLARESPLMSMVLRGRVDLNYLPPYLVPEGLKKIKPRLNRIEIATDDLISFLEKSPPNSYDCFSLSDVASYIPFSDFERMIAAVYHCAKPGARFSIRQFLTKYEIPQQMAAHFKRDHKLEEQLSREDRCFVYRFMTGTVQKQVNA